MFMHEDPAVMRKYAMAMKIIIERLTGKEYREGMVTELFANSTETLRAEAKFLDALIVSNAAQ